MIILIIFYVFGVFQALTFHFKGNLKREHYFDERCGEEASTKFIHQNPWLVFLEFYRKEYKTDIRCGGTLVDSRHIITAAHCVKKPKFTSLIARLGEYDVYSKIDCIQEVCNDPVVRINVSKIIVHPEYKGKSHDIAILKLEIDALFTDFIRPVCLPTGILDINVTFTASGWGEIPFEYVSSSTKKIIPLPLIQTKLCKEMYKSIQLPDHVICAGGEEGVDTCRGDSGGPLTWTRNRAELWGVTSFGNVYCGTRGSPGVYTKVIDYLEWIKDVIASVDRKIKNQVYQNEV